MSMSRSVGSLSWFNPKGAGLADERSTGLPSWTDWAVVAETGAFKLVMLAVFWGDVTIGSVDGKTLAPTGSACCSAGFPRGLPELILLWAACPPRSRRVRLLILLPVCGRTGSTWVIITSLGGGEPGVRRASKVWGAEKWLTELCSEISTGLNRELPKVWPAAFGLCKEKLESLWIWPLEADCWLDSTDELGDIKFNPSMSSSSSVTVGGTLLDALEYTREGSSSSSWRSSCSVRIGESLALMVLALELVRGRKVFHTSESSLLLEDGLPGHLGNWEPGLSAEDSGADWRGGFFLDALPLTFASLLLLSMEAALLLGAFPLLPPSGLSIHQELFPVASLWTLINLLCRDRLCRIEFWKKKRNKTHKMWGPDSWHTSHLETSQA